MPQKPYRKVGDDEISPYQGWGDKKAMQRAQSRKRRQVRNSERSGFEDLPEEWQPTAKVFWWIGIAAIIGIPLLQLL